MNVPPMVPTTPRRTKNQPNVAAGDEVVLLGEQGAQAITAEELAGAAGTVGYEIVARIGRRVPREYTG